MNEKFERVAIINRGEAAMRFIHAAREFNQELGTALRSIALFTEPDRRAMFVREADEAVCLGPAQVLDPVTKQRKSSYLDYARLERTLVAARVEAVWTGWGFVAEHAAFADLCRELGIVFIGPDGDAMRCVGDKIAAKKLAERVQIPVAPWSGGAVETVEDARHHAERLGYPLLIKAAAGGGGHGIRRVNSASRTATRLRERPGRCLQSVSAIRPSFLSNSYRARVTSKSRSSPIISEPRGRSGCAIAASSDVTRRCLKRLRRPRCLLSRTSYCATPPYA